MPLKLNLLAWYQRLSARERKIFQAGMGCLLVFLIDLTVVRPVWSLYGSLQNEIAEAERTLTRNLLNLQRKEAVESAYEKYRAFVRPAGTDEEENAGLLSELEQLARTNQVVLVDMKPREAKATQFHKEYAAELDAEADMKNLIAFMHQLGQSPQLMKVVNARFAAKGDKTAAVKARITVTKTTFVGGT
ncbi:MAG: type 4a pilus biogenesis protein PilO [Deltaproteobacteria bacterium]|nr:type 4a pilus biogenesis protein PilO [Deltaproteobacteria bacterium]